MTPRASRESNWLAPNVGVCRSQPPAAASPVTLARRLAATRWEGLARQERRAVACLVRRSAWLLDRVRGDSSGLVGHGRLSRPWRAREESPGLLAPRPSALSRGE